MSRASCMKTPSCIRRFFASHVWMRHVHYARAADLWKSHVTTMSESQHMYQYVTYIECALQARERVISHVYEWVTSHVWLRRVIYTNMSYIWICHIRHAPLSVRCSLARELRHAHERVMSHVCTNHVSHMNIRHTFKFRAAYLRESHTHTATHCNTLRHTATHCNTLQHTATHCNILARESRHKHIYLHTYIYIDIYVIYQDLSTQMYTFFIYDIRDRVASRTYLSM